MRAPSEVLRRACGARLGGRWGPVCPEWQGLEGVASRAWDRRAWGWLRKPSSAWGWRHCRGRCPRPLARTPPEFIRQDEDAEQRRGRARETGDGVASLSFGGRARPLSSSGR
ncbi:conserved hypothetical protein [Citreicella sp. SE45]|nr:conserved hypothetical protein [Citreicella sp. SE45]